MALAPGRDLSHYRLIEHIGEGGMGVVWKATDTTLGRAVAIKVLPEAFAGDPERMARFEREARLLASLNHPHIASIYGVGSADGVRFLAMELVEGDDLAVRLAHGPMPVVEAIEIAREVAEALEAAHEKGIIHRDLKPANVKLTADGQVKVLDFGLAKALEDEVGFTSSSSMLHSPTLTSPMTAANVILGTAAYMSPEQARGKSVDRRADIWAFGCVLHECLTGQSAFAGETVSDTIAKILEREPDFEALPAATPQRVRELLQRCLTKDHKARLRDIGDARIVLEEVLATRSPSGRLPLAEAPKVGAARRTFLFGSLAGVAAGVLIGAVAWGVIASRARLHTTETACLSVAMPEDLAIDFSAITLDGRTLILLAKPKKADRGETPQNRVYSRRLDHYEWRPLEGTEGTVTALPTLDGRSLLFIRPISEATNQRRLYRMPLDGSAPATALANMKESSGTLSQMWNGDLLVMEGTANLVRIPAGGGAPSAPIRLDAGRPGVEQYAGTPAALPGDHALLVNVISYESGGYHYSVGVADLETGKVKIIIEEGGNPIHLAAGYVLFIRGDALLAVRFDAGSLETRGAPIAIWSGIYSPTAYRPGRYKVTIDGALFYRPGRAERERTLAVLDAAGNLKPWSSEPHEFNEPPSPSPDGRRFACVITNGRAIDEIWISELDRPGLRRLGSDPSADCNNPLWSPNGANITYVRAARDERDGVYVQSTSGGDARLVLRPESEQVEYRPFSWLPDGSALLLHRESEGRSGLVMLALAGDGADTSRTRRVAPSEFSKALPRISPDGHWLAYLSDESGKIEVYVTAFHPDGSTGTPVQASVGGGGVCQWSADGKALFYFHMQEHMKLSKVLVTNFPTLSISAPTEILDMDKLGLATGAVLPDGRFLMTVKGENEGVLTSYNLVLNWTRELERKMRAAR